MAARSKSRRKATQAARQHTAAAAAPSHKARGAQNINLLLSLVVAVCGFLLYANTLGHQYALDDYPTIKGNKLTQQGLAGIPTLLHTSYWYGLDGNNDWLYRPLSMVMFATEWHFFPDSPHVYHFVNVFFYALTGFVLFPVLRRMMHRYDVIFPFAASLLFMAHPLHTEVIANIKSRDEIMCFLFLLTTIFLVLKFIDKQHPLFLMAAGLSYFLALFAKESAITFLAVIPLLVYFFTDATFKKNGWALAVLLVMAVVYLGVRAWSLDSLMGKAAIPVVDNAMMSTENTFDRLATAMLILGIYLKLLLFPHPLVYDYSYNHVPITSWSDPYVLLSLLAHGALGFFALLKLKEKNIFSFCILYYLATISLVANILFLTRSTGAERFLYMPSLVFVVALVVAIGKATKSVHTAKHYSSLASFVSSNRLLLGLLLLLLIPYTAKTISRNKDWENDDTLLGGDVKRAPQSVRAQYLWGNHLVLSIKEKNITDPGQTQQVLGEAAVALQNAIDILPSYHEPYVAMGSVYTSLNDYNKALTYYIKAVELNPYDANNHNNLGNGYYRLGNYNKALQHLLKAVALNPKYERAYSNLGSVYTALKEYDNAIEAYLKAIKLNPEFVDSYNNLGSVYGMKGDFRNSIKYLSKGVELDPENSSTWYFLSLSYQHMKDTLNARRCLQKANALKK